MGCECIQSIPREILMTTTALENYNEITPELYSLPEAFTCVELLS